MRVLVGLSLLVLAGCSKPRVAEQHFDLALLPPFDNGLPYRLEQFVPAAMALQSMGRERGFAALLRVAGTPETVDKSVYEKVAVLCRMLFTPRPGREFLRPSLGGPNFHGDTTYADWPLEPIEIVDGYPFWISRGYRMGGAGGPISDYVRYCIAECDWSALRFRELSAPERRTALSRLLMSPKWKRSLDERERWFLSSQVE
jgi:hypothetical protein